MKTAVLLKRIFVRSSWLWLWLRLCLGKWRAQRLEKSEL